MRKTIEVQWIKNKTNELLALSVDEMIGERSGSAAVLEAVLFETGNYKGFKYLSSEWNEETESLREGYDETRKVYF